MTPSHELEGFCICRPTTRSTAASEFAFTATVASVLTFPEKFLVGHDRFVRVVRFAVRNVILVVRYADHESSCFGHPIKYDTELTHDCLQRLGRQRRLRLR